MNRLLQFLFSTRLTAVLLLVFCAGMGVATFIENDFGTPTARKLVFDAFWFEAVIFLLALNFIGNINKYRMWKQSSWPTLLFHLSFVVIIIGAAVSRFISYEGIMHIREGESSNVIVSDMTYLQVFAGEERYERKLNLTPGASNAFKWSVAGAEVEYAHYIPHAKEVYTPDPEGAPVLHLVVSGNNSGRTEIYLSPGQVKDVFGTAISFDAPELGEIKIYRAAEDSIFILPQHEIPFMRMEDQGRGTIPGGVQSPLLSRQLYMHGSLSFVFKEYLPSAKIQLISSQEKADQHLDDVLVVKVRKGEHRQEVVLTGQKGKISTPVQVQLGDDQLLMRYGSKAIETPFFIYLDDFQLERYPGSESPASYASEVHVVNGSDAFPYRIYMNHVLDHQGYRFFQASYDTDEQGTVLSVNHDGLGTMITYIGYFLMMFGMAIVPFWKGSRFRNLVSSLKNKKATTLALLLLATGTVQAQDPDSLLAQQRISPAHAEQFARLLTQDEGGRIKPISTSASETLRKLIGKQVYGDFNATQIFLGLHADPQVWSHIPLVKIYKGKHTIEDLLPVEGKYARYIDLFDTQGNYLLADITEEVSQKKTSEQSERDKLIMEISQRVTLLYEIFNGHHLRIFPMPGDPNHKWYSYTDRGAGFQAEDSLFVYHMLPYYFSEVRKAMGSGDWEEADKILAYFPKFQKHYGSEILPGNTKVKLEIAYNNSEVFNKLFKYYGLFGLLLLIVLIAQILRQRKWHKWVVGTFTGIIAVLLLAHTAGLGIRWYISGHAPWSNAYESMVYVAWFTVVVGFIFMRYSKIPVAATAIMASIFLMVAHWNWMNPEIGNLVPVLNSYWLMIHVAIIVASYGPFTLNLILGVIALFLIIFRNKANGGRLDEQLSKLTTIGELIMTIGVFLLAIGTFLGGVWANESWGRYWSWDPKETWALISVMVYTFVLHMRLIPGLRGRLAFNIASIFTYASIMMTYFGVNFYLAGMHSYAKGDPIPVPSFIYYLVGSMLLLSFVAYLRNKAYENSGEMEH